MDRPNIVWITVDSVRSDHTTLDGYERDTTPTLESLASSGRGYKNCIAHGRSTLPSSGAILTGQAPSHTTLGITGDVLPESIRTVPERFAAAGYETACLSGNSFVGNDTELNRGFDRYQWLSSSTLHELGPGILLNYLFNIRKHSAGFTLDASKHSSPHLMNAVAKRWLDDLERGSDPFFFYLHYNEPHRPYYPPLPYRDLYTDEIEQGPVEAGETSMRVHQNLNEIIAEGADLSESDWDAIEAMYDAEIAYTDHMLGNLAERLKRIPEQTIVVITADHGELFGEYGLLSHKYILTDAVTRVPLVITGLQGTSLVPEESDLIQHVDVMWTLLELAGADTSDMLGINLRSERRERAVSQRGPPDFDQILQHNPEWDKHKFHDGLLTSVRSQEWRYQRSDDCVELAALPNEYPDVLDQYPDIAAEMADWLEQWLENHGQPVASSREGEFSEATKRQLRELGYIE